MEQRKTYRQFCGLARALDHIGDRWTMLIIRDLLLGPRTFRELAESLDGLSAPLLSARLRELSSDGLVLRNAAPVRSKTVTYRLTPAGAALEPAMLELIRWGGRWMADGPGADRADPRWTLLGLRALLAGQTNSGEIGSVQVVTERVVVVIEMSDGVREIREGSVADPRAVVRAGLPQLLAVASGARPPQDLDRQVEGDVVFARAALTPLNPVFDNGGTAG